MQQLIRMCKGYIKHIFTSVKHQNCSCPPTLGPLLSVSRCGPRVAAPLVATRMGGTILLNTGWLHVIHSLDIVKPEWHCVRSVSCSQGYTTAAWLRRPYTHVAKLPQFPNGYNPKTGAENQFRGLLMGQEGFHVMAQGVPGHLQLAPGLA